VIDVRTLLVLVAVADAAAAAILWTGAGRRLRHGVAGWIASLFCRSIACVVLALSIEPQAGLFAVSGALMALAITLQAAALLTYESRHLPTWVHSAAIAAVAVPFALVGSDAGSAILFGGVTFGTLLAALTAIAFQLRTSTGARARNVLVAAFAVGSAAFYFRGLGVMLVADPLQAFIFPTALQSAVFVAAAGSAIAGTFAFMLLQRERADREALHLATIDPLTGAYNRSTFHEIAEREISRARRAGQPLSMIMVDIDHFRPVNESFGIHAGDELLRKIAGLIRTALRQEDMLVRYGGEEFLVMLPEVPGPGAVVVAGRIRKAVEAAALVVEGKSVALTVSVGVSARLDEGPESLESLLARAEQALALAKQRGRNRVVALSLGRSLAA
jgi:diguanylate cyclase (GGDEF)-like protein